MPSALHDREKVTFSPNIPVIVELQSEGVLKMGAWGDQWQYFLGGHRIMWVDPPLHEAIQRSGARLNDSIAICKRQMGAGKNRRITWEVELQADEPAEAQGPSPATQQRQPAPVAQMPAAKPAADEWEVSPEDRARAEARWKAATSQPDQELFTCLIAAIDAAAMGEHYAASKAMDLHFSAEDVRAMALSIFIRRKEGR